MIPAVKLLYMSDSGYTSVISHLSQLLVETCTKSRSTVLKCSVVMQCLTDNSDTSTNALDALKLLIRDHLNFCKLLSAASRGCEPHDTVGGLLT
jgi:hypothetical protein